MVVVDPDFVDDIRLEAFLADSAEAVNGKIYALGIGFSMIQTRQATFPLSHGGLAVAVVVHVPYRMTNEKHAVTVRLVDQDGQSVPLNPGGRVAEGATPMTQMNGEFSVGRPASIEPGDEQVVPMVFSLRGITFPAPDLYSVVISVKDDEKCRLPLRVRRTT